MLLNLTNKSCEAGHAKNHVLVLLPRHKCLQKTYMYYVVVSVGQDPGRTQRFPPALGLSHGCSQGAGWDHHPPEITCLRTPFQVHPGAGLGWSEGFCSLVSASPWGSSQHGCRLHQRPQWETEEASKTEVPLLERINDFVSSCLNVHNTKFTILAIVKCTVL